jgi:putative holliday junction resolvase
MKILGIDVGTKRIGLAISDPLGITAQGLFTVNVETEDALSKIGEVISKGDVKEIVVGLPLNMNGTKGPQAVASSGFADKLKERFNIPVRLWDERMTTMQVERIMIDAGTRRNNRKKNIDKLAAQVMLQSYLEANKNV